jgi:hypothetical protein
VKFRAPGGTIAELVPIGRYKNEAAAGRKIDKIVHLSLKVDDVQSTGDFYQQVFGFRDSETKKTRDHVSRHMTDGQIDFTLMKYDAGTQSAESKAAGEGPASITSRSRSRICAGDGGDQGPRLRDRERPGRDPGEVPRPRRHGRRTRSPRPLQAITLEAVRAQRRLLVGARPRRAGRLDRGRGARVDLTRGDEGPGPGFFPLWYGGAMIVLSLVLVAGAVMRPQAGKGREVGRRGPRDDLLGRVRGVHRAHAARRVRDLLRAPGVVHREGDGLPAERAGDRPRARVLGRLLRPLRMGLELSLPKGLFF